MDNDLLHMKQHFICNNMVQKNVCRIAAINIYFKRPHTLNICGCS